MDAVMALVEAPPTAPPASAGESLGYGAAQGATLGFGDEIQGAIQATIRKLAEDDPQSWGALYAQERDWARNRDKRAAESNPKTFVAGSLAGALGTAGAGGGAVRGGTVLARAAKGGALGAGYGGVAGAGASEADTVGGVARDAAGGALLGAATGGAVPLAGAALRQTLAKYAPSLGERAVEQGRKALSGIGTSLAARKPISREAVVQAIDTGAIRPLGTVSGAATRLASQADDLGSTYGLILEELEAQGVKGPNAVLLAKKLEQAAAVARKTSLGSPRPSVFSDAAKELREKVDPRPFADKRLGLGQTEAIKRDLQHQASASYDKLAGRKSIAGEAQEELASTFREAIEDEISKQSALAPDAAARFQPVKQALARTLEARKAAQEGAARAARRKAVSLTDTIAGTGVGVATGNPILGAIGAAVHGVADRRLSSTAAVLLRALEKQAQRAGQRAPGTAAAPAVTAEEVALLDLLGLRGAPALAQDETDEALDNR
jgi:hypothetical protein